MQILFGKYRGLSVDDLILKDYNYIKWLSNQPFIKDDMKAYINEKLTEISNPGYTMKWGKYRCKTIPAINELDSFYIEWLKNNDFAKKDLLLMKEIEKLYSP